MASTPEKAAAYYIANRDKLRARHKAYHAAHKQENLDRGRAWRAANPERALAARRRAHGIVDAPGVSEHGPCTICGLSCYPLHCDHDHTTGYVRGWLCPNCNRGLGMFGDDPNILRLAAEYLERDSNVR